MRGRDSCSHQVYHEYMANSGISLARYFRRYRIRTVEGFRTAALEKVASAFNAIAEEADAVAKAKFEHLRSMPVDDETDIAEWATHHGMEYYETMSGVRQGVLNLLTVGLHHLFEQQQVHFLWSELAPGRGEEKRYQAAELERRLTDLGIDCRSFPCARKLYELKTAANTIKHGAGPSANTLATLRPDLLEDPTLANNGSAEKGPSGSVPARVLGSSLLTPLAGSDIYVSERDLSDWCAAVIAYWEELYAILDEQQHHQADR